MPRMPDPAVHQVRLSPRAVARHFNGFVGSLRSATPETRGTYARALREFVRWFPRDGSFRFRVGDVRRYKRYLETRKRLSAVSVSTYLTAFRRFCDYLVRNGVLKENPGRYVGGNSRPATHSREYLSPEDVSALLSAVPQADLRGMRDYAMILLMLRCALSEIELIRADMRDVYAEEGRRWMLVQGKGRKTKDERVGLPPDVVSALDRYLAARGSARPTEPLFASAGNRTRGQRMTTRGIRDRVNTNLTAAGVKQGKVRRVTPFSLRHTAALLMARNGATADEIRQRMRLGSNATAELYLQYEQSRDEQQQTITKEEHGALPVQHD
ncbi:MAG: tyrosine-type recombinase/integrase [Bacteroidetes bacterium]|nr:tyrosine-type recombinase/integrase [Bacteroidota bacterium]